MKLVLFVFVLLMGSNARSYVENVTHGYPNCMACHVSPTGGGVLTDYGRSLSSELMSSIKTKNFQNPFFGLGKNTTHVKWGGNARQIQTRYENNQVKRGSSFIMQNNIEAAAYVKEFVFVGTAGTKEGPKQIDGKGDFISERHYGMYRAAPTVTVKAGKFRQNYGINEPNHTRFTKQNLGFGSNSETYGLEVFKVFEKGEAIVSTSLGDFSAPGGTRERNVMAQGTHYLGGNSRLSANVLLGESSETRRALYGVSGVFPLFSKNNVFRFELDYQVSEQLVTSGPRNEKTHGIYGNMLIGRKVFDGFFPYLVYEHRQTDLDFSRNTLTTSPGLGFQFFPIAHLEIQFEHQYRTLIASRDNPEHRSFVVVHVYH
jgi:hypothetical protein